jgi:polar amino acid transport system substrate-binding protein
MLQDVTRERLAQQEAGRQRSKLAEAERLASLGTLLAGLTHELNNPNHSILLNVPVLRRAWQDAKPVLERHAASSEEFRLANVPWAEMREEIPQVIDEIEQAAERIKRLVSRLREYALKHRPAVEWLDVNDVVRAAVELVRETVEVATARFTRTLAEDLPPISGSSFRLEQVVAALLLNACESLSDREQGVRLITGRQQGDVFVRVEDDGRGIAAEDLPQVRDPFFTTRRAEGGTGLGLAVAARIAREHGGRLDLQSEPGIGTTVTLIIPTAGGGREEGNAT